MPAAAQQVTVDQINKDVLRARLEKGVVRHEVPGMSVAIFRGGKDLITAAAGVTNITTGVALTEDTVMHIGSITKVFNATLIMQLVDEGKVDLDARVMRYLPDLKLKDSAALNQITVRMLLNHTSGIDGVWLPERGHDEETLEKTVARFADLDQLFSPGTDVSYNNVAAVIAGYLAQRLAGKSWYRLIRERVFEPLHMTHAATLPEEALLHRCSVGHFLKRGPPEQWSRTSHAFLGLGFAPAGSTLMMSASDLIAFARSHMMLDQEPSSSRLLSASSAKAMQQMSVGGDGKANGEDGFGLGWVVSSDGLLAHGGGGPGIHAFLCVYPAQRFAAACLANSAGPRSLLMIHDLLEPWFRELGASRLHWWAHDEIPPELPKIRQENYVGVYENALNRRIVVPMGDGLAMSFQRKFTIYDSDTTEPGPPVRLIPLGDDRFLLEATNEFDARFTGGRRVAFRALDQDGRPRLLALATSVLRRRSR